MLNNIHDLKIINTVRAVSCVQGLKKSSAFAVRETLPYVDSEAFIFSASGCLTLCSQVSHEVCSLSSGLAG